MPHKGQILVNSATGDNYEFLETSADTHGERVSILTELKTKEQLVPNHFHVLQDETFEIISGKLTIMLDRKYYTLSAGDKKTLPKNIAHNHYNNHDEPAKYIHSITPALDFEYLIENLVGLASDGKSKNGKYGLVQELVTLKYLDSKAFLADKPVAIQKILMEIIAPIGRLFGKRAIYRKYSDIEK